LNGSAYNIASHCELRDRGESQWTFVLAEDQATLFNDRHRALLERGVCDYLGRPLAVQIELGMPTGETPAQRRRRLDAERLLAAAEAINGDPRVQRLAEEFGAEVVAGSVSVDDSGEQHGPMDRVESV
jgi:DNA polymerase-3 subunit gamma/tau